MRILISWDYLPYCLFWDDVIPLDLLAAVGHLGIGLLLRRVGAPVNEGENPLVIQCSRSSSMHPG